MDGFGVVISWPMHISYSKWPKQMISTFSMSVVERDHITAFIRDDSPNRPFSRPDNLRFPQKENKTKQRVNTVKQETEAL